MSDARDLAAIPLVEPGEGAELHLGLVRAGAAVSQSCSVLLRPSPWLRSYSRRRGSKWGVPIGRQRFGSRAESIRLCSLILLGN
jgi:hypothetical protein